MERSRTGRVGAVKWQFTVLRQPARGGQVAVSTRNVHRRPPGLIARVECDSKAAERLCRL